MRKPAPVALLRAACLLTLLLVGRPGDVFAQSDAGGLEDAGARPDAGLRVDPRTAQVRALIEGGLELAVEPQDLFDVSLLDETAVQVEAERIRAVLKADDEAHRDAGPKGRNPAAPSLALAGTDLDAWNTRTWLDRARLDFLALPRAERATLLEQHARAQAAARVPESEAERRVREATKEEERTREAARLAQSEAERLVAEERTRVAALEKEIASARLHFEEVRKDLSARRDVVLGWQRRAREARTATDATSVDATYDALRRVLHDSRDDLEKVLGAAGGAQTTLPQPGPDGLLDVPARVPTEEVRARRDAAYQALREAQEEERALGEDRAAQLLEEINVLNRERLALLPFLSAAKRDATTGFSLIALDQARAEGRHLLLTLRAHWQVTRRWLGDARQGEVDGVTVWRVFAVLVPWVLATLAFVWLRRRSPAVLTLAESREARADRARRAAHPGPRRRALAFLRSVHRPLEGLLFFGVLLWLLPASARDLLEVRLLAVIASWSLVASLVVDAINALAAGDASHGGVTSPLGALRLRSLRLVGRVVVGFALALVLCTRLVGQGTVYSWVLVGCWSSVVPLFLVLVRWWRETVFQRLDRRHRKSRVQVWVLDNRKGWKSFLAAMVGAVHLFGTGFLKTARSWLTSFELTRRVHAWLYRRELARMAEATPAARALPLRAEVSGQLSPERSSAGWVPCSADEHLEALRLRVPRGGVVAIVGARGVGKSSLLRRLRAQVEGTVEFCCTPTTRAAELPAGPLVLLDDVEAMIKPLQGGLKDFDAVLARARASSEHTLWVFSIDDLLWPFLQRARDGRELFDQVLRLEPWSDEEIGALLQLRSEEAGIDPVFDDLLERLPPSSDEIDRLDALAARRAGYYRMTWDYARGNPAMALEAWRASLVEGPTGEVRVRPLVAPDSTTLEGLPDTALFVLRAVLQLTPAAVVDLTQATRMSELQVRNALSFGQAQGYFLLENGRVRIASPWLRPVMVVLERRHLLLVSP